MSTKIAVIGAGPGGYIAAVRAAQMGGKVILIEHENLGGTCLNWGCIPSKIMIASAEMLSHFQKAKEFGIITQSAPFADMKLIMQRKNSIIQTQIKGISALLDKHKIQVIKGKAYIKDYGIISVNNMLQNNIEIKWDKLIIASGTSPLEIPDFPFDSKMIISSNDALCLEKIPKSIMILGGGVIGCEFACIFASLGSKVTIIEAMPRLIPLDSIDEDCSKILQREMKKKKIKFILNKTADSFEKLDNTLKIHLGPSPFLKNPLEKDKKKLTLEAEKILVSIGRQPNSKTLGLENINVKTDNKGWILVDEKMQTNVENVYAIGDILGPSKIMLAHAASAEAEIAAENAMGKNTKMDYNLIPEAIFTSPEIAGVGLTETQAKEKGLEIQTHSVLFRTIGKAQVIGEIAGQAKIVSDAKTNKILGVHIIGPHASELIAEGTLAIKMGASAADIAKTIHTHPTLCEIMMETSFKSVNMPLHG